MENRDSAFQRLFGSLENTRRFFAPGRVNVIGEHTDYNGGHVFPCALNIGTYATVRKRPDLKVQMYSVNFPDRNLIEFDLEHLYFRDEDDWGNYPKGVVAQFQQAGYTLDSGLEIVFEGNIPNGAGLSSSASIELATAVLVNQLFSFNLEMLELVKMAQKAENEFVGVHCGIMDQFSIGFGKQDHAVLLDCKTFAYSYSPIKLDGLTLMIANTNKQRGLADSKYNERRQECERALQALQQAYNVQNLCDLTLDEFRQCEDMIPDKTDRKRARHAISENERTLHAHHALVNGDIGRFGQLMNESHQSLRDDYEVTGPELDALVEAAWEYGALGARMTGAGFGGCTVNVVESSRQEEFIRNVSRKYREQTGLEPYFYAVAIADGAHEL
ncbi:galactokinase [Virgibacillus sp. MSP4-1]|uniref:galactokinase n=1 Tax=Virgibacillus sp. MSP4-1 TaxID=2700081 RepID=UPI0005C60CC7|nr:galactokinase [Virgibacillus sp. MSP4-1]QHS23323.1 galactokinase [Virgibacillus sp. MSP4-1]